MDKKRCLCHTESWGQLAVVCSGLQNEVGEIERKSIALRVNVKLSSRERKAVEQLFTNTTLIGPEQK
jgi:hypothetical protein